MAKWYADKQFAMEWIDENRERLSDFDLQIWNYAEPAWREYRSSAAYCDLLRTEGFDVEEGSGDMPTAFVASYGGLHSYLGVSKGTKVYLDNGAFYFLTRGGDTPVEQYEEFVERAVPDWYPIPRDYIPTPAMSEDEQRVCFDQTMQANSAYEHDGYAPVVHIGRFLDEYVARIRANEKLSSKKNIALGGIVPNLLRKPKAAPYQVVLDALIHVRRTFADKEVHVFGMGGTATLHLAALLGVDSVDSSGWRNRAARGIVQLPGSGDRMVAELGSWRGRGLSPQEREILQNCQCPACAQSGLEGLTASRIKGFCNRATHNLWVLLEEVLWVGDRLKSGKYREHYEDRLDNSIYKTPYRKYRRGLSENLWQCRLK